MGSEVQGCSAPPGEIRQQLALSRQIGVSFATVNRWNIVRSKMSRLAETRFAAFCGEMTKQGRLVLLDGP
jgi:hypothetical protein